MELDAKRWPDAQNDDPSAFYKVPLSRVIYMEQSDFQNEDSKNYYGLAPGKSVLLRYTFPIKCTNVVFADDTKTVCEIYVEYDPEKKIKPKGVLHWVPEYSPGKEPTKVEVCSFENLFNSENPAELNDDWLTDINPQLQSGYYTVDKDSIPGKLVFNRTVTLKDGYKKGGK
ncbi:unnamed protein product [Arabidopsis thaliana]|nr:unnamed protein product [Arabidopsis thaliana]